MLFAVFCVVPLLLGSIVPLSDQNQTPKPHLAESLETEKIDQLAVVKEPDKEPQKLNEEVAVNLDDLEEEETISEKKDAFERPELLPVRAHSAIEIERKYFLALAPLAILLMTAAMLTSRPPYGSAKKGIKRKKQNDDE